MPYLTAFLSLGFLSGAARRLPARIVLAEVERKVRRFMEGLYRVRPVVLNCSRQAVTFFVAAERRPNVARGERSEPLESDPATQWQEPWRGDRVLRPSRAPCEFTILRSRGCAALHPWLRSVAAPRLQGSHKL